MKTEDQEIDREERAIYAIITFAILPVVIGMLLEGRVFDAGGTLSLALVVLGVIGLVVGFRLVGARRIPRARVHRRDG
jgi:hypothetical protein